LIHRPQILILDEPTTGVDAVSRLEFWDLLRDIREKQITIIVSTPYMDEAAQCDRIAMIRQGRIYQTDTPDSITRSYEKILYEIKTGNLYHSKNRINSHFGEGTALLFGQSLHVTLSNDTEETLLKEFLLSQPESLINLQKINPGIEDCFIRQTYTHDRNEP
jgi:ABC-2 type transport system ATP-binding protein